MKMVEGISVLYSFPHKLGADRICMTAWQQVNGLAAAGAKMFVCAGSLYRPVHYGITVRQTLGRGRIRIPYRLIGSMRAFELHDYVVSRRLEQLAGEIDIVHAWPMGALRTLKTARRLGIPAVIERPNAHTEFAYEVVKKECDMLGIELPSSHEHSYKSAVINKERLEYDYATRLLCPSDFVVSTFLQRGFTSCQLARHQYGYDESVFYPDSTARPHCSGLRVIFVGGCAPRKGLHYALEAWLQSDAHRDGEFLVAGAFVPAYAEKLAGMLGHRSVHVLGHRTDIPKLMRSSDILVLPSIEEGSALVTAEARGSGCVLLVSDASGAQCTHMENALVHRVGDVQTLAQQMTALHRDRLLLERLRDASLSSVGEITWKAAGRKLLEVYRETIEREARKVPGSTEISATMLA